MHQASSQKFRQIKVVGWRLILSAENWMVSVLLISDSSSPTNKPSGIVPSTPTINGMTTVCSVVCERWVETGTDCYIDPSSSFDHSCTSFASLLGLLNCGSLRVQPSVSCFSLWHACLNWLTAVDTVYILS